MVINWSPDFESQGVPNILAKLVEEVSEESENAEERAPALNNLVDSQAEHITLLEQKIALLEKEIEELRFQLSEFSSEAEYLKDALETARIDLLR